MKNSLISLLRKNGYTIYHTDDYFIVRKNIISSWGILVLFMILGFSFTVLGVLTLTMGLDWTIGVPITVVGVLFLIAPFFNYLTASYRSLVIDRHNKTILFRSGYSRAYLFTEVKEVKLEVQASQADANAFSESNKEFQYTISAYMVRGGKEQLLSLKFRNEESEQLMFALKDYFQTLLTYNS
ncbi:MAG: hypothetical protein ABJF11_06985 [Reichenbachiella sp.]|uniref:hypothetical protein n=1 Tax=Reichenbachiella sp. TaxID=2184521 RepID=UPI003267DF9F